MPLMSSLKLILGVEVIKGTSDDIGTFGVVTTVTPTNLEPNPWTLHVVV